MSNDSTSHYDFDIVIATDLRFPGGNSSSVAEEIRAQSAAGFTTGLLHVPSPVVKVSRAFNARLVDTLRSRQAELVRPSVPVKTKLLVVRHPTTLINLQPRQYPINADRSVVIANQVGTIGDRVIYAPEVVGPEFEANYGSALWAPISPLVRASLAQHVNVIKLTDEDWFNIIDVDEWLRNRTKPASPPTIGRHSRDHALKWPAHAAEIRAAYPATSEFKVRVLGGANSVADVLGEVPKRWDVLPYAVDGARDFLRSIDFFVYFHHPELQEAFGRAIFEALASGAVAIIPTQYEPLFGEACVYAKPEEVQDIVRAYVRDEVAYRAQSARGANFARAKFGHDIHRSRVAALIGSPSPSPSPLTAASSAPTARRRLLFMSSNGAGVGHLTRLMAMARNISPDYLPVIFTLSQGIRWVEESGFAVEYLPSQRYLAGDTPNPSWNKLLQDRLEHLIELYRPAGIIFDGTQPYRGLLDALKAHPEIAAAWSRRGMWQPHITKNLRGLSEHFDLVIEPGEIAASRDRGITRKFRKHATVVDPITFLNHDELLPTHAARVELGLDQERPAALIQLGAGNINDTSSLVNAAVMTLAENPSFQIRIARSAISGRLVNVPGAEWVDAYPLSRYLNAFDFVVGAAGYNTFHETVGFGVPSVLVPNNATEVDDQVGRAEFASSRGAALVVNENDLTGMQAAIRRMMNRDERDKIKNALHKLRPQNNGASAAMVAFEDVANRKTGQVNA